jgi:D-amino peptidase
MKLYLMTDLEGVAGVYDWESRDDTSPMGYAVRARQQRWLAQEVSAAVDGLCAGGATRVIVNDGHGAGYTIDLDHVDPRAEVINGLNRPFWLPYQDGCDAAGIVGGHAKAGTPDACLCHTMSTAIREWTFNGISLGEMGLQAAIAGHFGVPFVFVTGDLHACREMEALIPGVVTVPVKIGIGRQAALQLPPARAQELIRAGARRAMDAIDKVEPFRLESPIRFRDERVDPVFDEENPPDGWQVVNAHVAETEAADIIDLMNRLYRYPVGWQPADWSM